MEVISKHWNCLIGLFVRTSYLNLLRMLVKTSCYNFLFFERIPNLNQIGIPDQTQSIANWDHQIKLAISTNRRLTVCLQFLADTHSQVVYQTIADSTPDSIPVSIQPIWLHLATCNPHCSVPWITGTYQADKMNMIISTKWRLKRSVWFRVNSVY